MTPIIVLALSALVFHAPTPAGVEPSRIVPGFSSTAATALQAPDPAKVKQGRQLFETNKCLLCHKLDGKGGILSVALDGVADRRDAEALARVLRDPATELKDSKAKVKMPKFPLSDEEVDALVAYLRTLKLTRGSAPDPGSVAGALRRAQGAPSL